MDDATYVSTKQKKEIKVGVCCVEERSKNIAREE